MLGLVGCNGRDGCQIEVGILGQVGTGVLHKGGAKNYPGRTGKPEEAPTEVGAARCRY